MPPEILHRQQSVERIADRRREGIGGADEAVPRLRDAQRDQGVEDVLDGVGVEAEPLRVFLRESGARERVDQARLVSRGDRCD